MLSKVYAPAHLGLESQIVEVECDISNGLPSLIIVGLPDKAIEEAKERLRSAIKNSGLLMPPKRITLNLAPADTPKDGTAYDLAMAVAILAASQQIALEPTEAIFSGELSLDGSLRSIKGALACAQVATAHGIKAVFLPRENIEEASLVHQARLFPVDSLKSLYRHLVGERLIVVNTAKPHPVPNDIPAEVDMSHIYGQEQAKRALEIAAAGGHNLFFSGPPGSGKTMLAKALAGILPPLGLEEMIEVTKLHSLAGANNSGIVRRRPFRNPHHTSSNIALIGGGRWPKPGEISLSHYGVLFLDELPEFPRSVLEVLRQPLEDGYVTVARATSTITFPAKFIFVATQNPCPCGYAGDPERSCTCSLAQITKYQRKISGPLMDRIDLVVEVPRVKHDRLLARQGGETSAQVAARVVTARAKQDQRFGNQRRTNAQMDNQELEKFCRLNQAAAELAKQALISLNLSARGYARVIKVARTIADIAASEQIEPAHLAEALQYRSRV